MFGFLRVGGGVLSGSIAALPAAPVRDCYCLLTIDSQRRLFCWLSMVGWLWSSESPTTTTLVRGAPFGRC
jgi:hypothetical protein